MENESKAGACLEQVLFIILCENMHVYLILVCKHKPGDKEYYYAMNII